MRKAHYTLIIIVAIVLVLSGILLAHYLAPTTPEGTGKFFCTSESRNAVCNDVGDRVCGWFNQSVKCLRYPCAINFDLRCEACKNPEVEYYTFGSCPTG